MTYLALARADFAERTRRFGFFVMMLGTLGMGWLGYSGHTHMTVGNNVRGVYNSAWIGAMMAMSAGLFVTMAGFYFVKNAIENDRRSGVGQILAATRTSSARYLVSKWFSNVAILSSVLVLLTIASGVLQLLRAERGEIDLVALVSPMLLIAFPAVCAVAAFAVLFETVPFLRGGFGNVAYFFFWGFAVVLSEEAKIREADFMGFSVLRESISTAYQAYSGSVAEGFSFSLGGGRSQSEIVSAFEWQGIAWTADVIIQRLTPVAISFALILLASLWFDRFDTSRGRSKAGRTTDESEAGAGSHTWETAGARLSVAAAAQRSRFLSMSFAELKILLPAKRWLWLLPTLGMMVAMLTAPIDAARVVVIVAALWPVLLWSKLGMRESWFGTDQILFSSPQPIRRQLMASYLAGVMLALLSVGAWGVRTLAMGEVVAPLQLLAGILFVPALALGLGVWSGSSRPFEALYVAIWYVGPANRVPALDFLASADGVSASRALVYALVAAALLGAAALGRKRQIEA